MAWLHVHPEANPEPSKRAACSPVPRLRPVRDRGTTKMRNAANPGAATGTEPENGHAFDFRRNDPSWLNQQPASAFVGEILPRCARTADAACRGYLQWEKESHRG